MSYKDPEKQKDAQRRSMAKARGVKPKDDVKPQTCETHVDVKPGVKPQSCETRLHTKDDVKPWGWPKYNAKGERINPATMQPYKAAMMAIAAHSPAAIAEYERKRVRKDVLVIADLPIEQRDYLYRCLQTVYRQS